MSIELHVLQRVRMMVEPTPGADGTANLAQYTDIPLREGTAQLELQMTEVDPQTQVQSRVGWRKLVPCKRRATLSFTINLAPTGSVADASTPATSGAVGMILKHAMGGEELGRGDEAASGSTATVVNVDNGARWKAGMVMGWENSSGVVEWSPIESVATNAVTLKKAFSAAPQEDDALYGAATYYFTESPSTTLQAIVAGRESDDRWLLMNGTATFTLAIDPSGNEMPLMNVTVTFLDWRSSDEPMAGTITGDIGDATYTNYAPIVGCGGLARAWEVGTATYSAGDEIEVSAFEFTPNIVWNERTSPSGDRWLAGRAAPPAQGSFTIPYQDTTWFARRRTQASIAVFYVQGHAPGSAIIYDAPTVQIVAPQRVAGAAEDAAQQVPWQARRDEDVGSSTGDLAKSPARIHLC